MLIVATIGINSFHEDKLRKIILSGADILRYNLSYHIVKDKIESLEIAEKVITDLNSSVKILLDLPTNKIRLGDFNERIFTVKESDEITLRSASYSQDCREFIPVEMTRLGEKTYVNQMITIGDGEVALQITEITNPETVRARVLNNGIIKYMKTFNTDQRIEDDVFLKYYSELLSRIQPFNAYYIAVPFINTRVNFAIKKKAQESSPLSKIVIKIERDLGDLELREIISDKTYAMVLLDRGELGVNEPFEKMGLIQRKIIKIMREARKPLLISTQILESTVNNYTPSRADIANLTEIVQDGADGIVFCHETTVGLRPGYTISVAKKIINEVAKYKNKFFTPFTPAVLIQFTQQNLPSLIEWMEKMKSPNLVEFKIEDNAKYERLESLRKYLNIHYDRPETFDAVDVYGKASSWQNLLNQRGQEICAIKLMPKTPELPKFRGIGETLQEYATAWLPLHPVDPNLYRVEVLKHNPDMKYSVIFLINDFGVWGDMIEGVHWQLTQGIHERGSLTFYYDFQNLWLYNDERSRDTEECKSILLDAIKKLQIVKSRTQYDMETELQAEFTPHGYLKGYFEFFFWPKQGLSLNDYNRVIYKRLRNLKLYLVNKGAELRGLCANPGKAEGKAKIINNPKGESVENGDILACKNINLDYLPLMVKAGAIIIEQGNFLSHLAIISRELKKPCIVNVKNITQKLKNGDKVRIDADKGIVEIIQTAAV